MGAISERKDAAGLNSLANAGAAYIFERDGLGNWLEKQKIVASDRDVLDLFGISVAISGNYAIVGAYYEDDDTSGTNYLFKAGSAYIFERDGTGNWIEKQKIIASDRSFEDRFGRFVAISGNYVIVGAYAEDEDSSGSNTLVNAGSAYVFERDGLGNWSEKQKIVASDRETGAQFGRSVALSGNHAIVSAEIESKDASGANTLSGAGAAYIFERDGAGNWTEKQKIVASDREAGDAFGYPLALSGNYAIVGAHYENEDSSGSNTLANAGSAYIFERNGLGNWLEKQKIVASDRAANDYFGYSVAISSNYAIVGALWEDEDTNGSNTLNDPGSAYIFERDGLGNWLEKQKIVASDRGDTDRYGWSVALSGNYVMVGAYYEDEDSSGSNTLGNAGSTYFYEYGWPIGLTENSFTDNFIYYPNPTGGNLTIEFDKIQENLTIRLLSISGKLIKNISYQNSKTIRLEINNPNGIYLLEIMGNNESKAAVRLLKE